ncbi:ABC transporter permease [Nocardia paucivorans]|uniref:ABC transporter permease n=1 Tax=Nocardia paucivorans TaxID=114259 RepID=UPI000319DC16|nr:ABC transporter permease [Nocardia paucivorans]
MIDVVPADLLPPLHAEYRKVVTLRYARVPAVLIPVVALLAASTTAILAGPQDPRGEPATGTATVGLYLALAVVILAVGAFAAASAGSEHRYDTIAVTALFTPDRDRLAGAKMLVAAGVALVAALTTEVVALACLLVFGRDKFEFGATLFGALGGGLLTAVCWAVIGTGLGLWLRSPLTAVGVMLGWPLFAEPLVWAVTSGLGLPGLATLLPTSSTVSTMAVGSFSDSDILAPTPAAMVVLLLWTLGIGGLGWWSVRTDEL